MILILKHQDCDDVLILDQNRPSGEQYSNAKSLRTLKSHVVDFLREVKSGKFDYLMEEK